MTSFLRWVGIERRGDRDISEFASRLAASQVELDPASARVLYGNLWDLYEGQPVQDKILTVPEVAELLRVHPSTIYRLLREKKISAFKLGSDWRFNLLQIDKWRLAQDGQQVK